MIAEPKIDPQRLIWLLKVRRKETGKPVPGQYIADHFGAGETKRVRECVHEMRRQGIPVCSSDQGYWYPVSREDAAVAIRHLTSLFQPLRESYNGFIAGLEREFGQDDLFSQIEDEEGRAGS